jgi:hypothetical protein
MRLDFLFYFRTPINDNYRLNPFVEPKWLRSSGRKNTIYLLEGSCRRQAAHRDQTYLGAAEGVRWLVQDRCSLATTTGSLVGLVLYGWLRVLSRCSSRSRPSPAHSRLLAAIDRICRPDPKTKIAA